MDPRRIVPNQTLLLTRRCRERSFFLRPRKEVNAILLYALAYSAQRYGIEVHAFVFSSNHYHLVVTDPEGKVSDFMRCMNTLIARALNVLHSRTEALWAQGSYDRRVIHGQDTTWEKLIYTIANPVKDGLVPTPEAWPGEVSLPAHLLQAPRLVPRPKGACFSGRVPAAGPAASRSGLPAKVALSLSIPPALRHLAPAAYHRELQHRLDSFVASVDREHFLGREKVLLQDPFDCPTSSPQRNQRGRPSPIACADGEQFKLLIREHERWLLAYRAAWEAYQRAPGDMKTSIPFPDGAFLIHVRTGCPLIPLSAA